MSLRDEIRATRSKLRDLEKALASPGRILITSHNNPDPDSIVSAVLLKKVLSKLGVRSSLGYSGVVGRAENVALVEYANAGLEPLSSLEAGRFGGVALVDTQPGTGNHSFEVDDDVLLVFDHHRFRSQTRRAAFADVRTGVGATTTLLYLYASAAGVKITRKLNTLMFYALRTETADLGREASRLDREAYEQFYAGADLKAISKIVNAKIEKAFFKVIYEGIRRCRIYGPMIVTELGDMPYPDVAAQIADYFLRYQGATYAFAIGRHGDELLMSLRADADGAGMGRIARHIVAGLGSAGGHGSAAGGQVSLNGRSKSERQVLQKQVIRRLLKAMNLSSRNARNLL